MVIHLFLFQDSITFRTRRMIVRLFPKQSLLYLVDIIILWMIDRNPCNKLNGWAPSLLIQPTSWDLDLLPGNSQAAQRLGLGFAALAKNIAGWLDWFGFGCYRKARAAHLSSSPHPAPPHTSLKILAVVYVICAQNLFHWFFNVLRKRTFDSAWANLFPFPKNGHRGRETLLFLCL